MNDPARKIISLDYLRRTPWLCSKACVATNGCFDILHAGHVRFLCAARALGTTLIVGVNDDESVRALKGEGRPLNLAVDRALVVAALECVDLVCVFSGMTAVEFLRAARPVIWCKGNDYARVAGPGVKALDAAEIAEVEAGGGRIELLPILQGYSSTALIARLV